MLDEHYWENTKNDALGSLLGDLSPYIFEGSISADPAAWTDWVSCVKKVSDLDMLKSDEVLQVCRIFLGFYMTDFGFDVGWILQDLEKLSAESDIWLTCVKKSYETRK